jgi:hypothetical protein
MLNSDQGEKIEFLFNVLNKKFTNISYNISNYAFLRESNYSWK